MKCSKCGEECNENQAFCLKCGNPIQIVPDLNLIEEELANNVGEMIDEIKEEQKTKELINTARYIYDYDDNDSLADKSDDDTLENFKPIQLDESIEEEIERANSLKKTIENTNSNTNGYTVDGAVSFKQHRKKQLSESEADERKERKMFKVKMTIAIIGIIIVLLIAILIIFWPSGSGTGSVFNNSYDKGLQYYNSGEYDKAVEEYEKAYESTKNEKSMKKALISLWDAYKKMDNSDDKIIDVLKKLIEIEPDKVEYYESLLSLYDKNGRVSDIDALIKSVEGTGIAAQLTGYAFSGPDFNYESGDYNQYIYISLSNTKGYKMYYTIDGSDPTTASEEYKDAFEINTEGTTVVKAISVNEKGISSSIVEKKFNIKLSELVAPTVNPESGTYTDVTQITIDVPVGMKAYYTLDEEGTVPTAQSKEYTGPVDMQAGKYFFSAILVNDQGVSSSVTKKLYQLNVSRTYTYNQALDSLKTNLIGRGIILDSEGNTSTGGKVEFSYVGVQVIEGNEYYLIQASTGEVYGVGSVTGVIKSLALNAEGVYEIAE